MSSPQPGQPALPIQPVERPILCSPYAEPTAHWRYDSENGAATRVDGRREASYWFKYETHNKLQRTLFIEEEREVLHTVNALRDDVRRWRGSGYRGATDTTKELLRYWWREDRPRRLFFCQLEAAETVIYLNEIRMQGGKLLSPAPKRPFEPQSTSEMLAAALYDSPGDPALEPLLRMACKMATGSGKTVVMALLLAWSFCNRGKTPSDERFPNAALVVCPNLTIKERLQVLRPEAADNYFAAFDLVPTRLRPLLQGGKVLVENWHAFLPRSEHDEGGKSYAVVNKGPEGPRAFARRVLGDLYDRAPILVFNDEAHHAWRPSPLVENTQTANVSVAELEEEIEEATIWVEGLDKLNAAVGVACCIDLSATPFYIGGSGHVEGSPLPWIVSDFGLVDAIESGIVKIPRLPVLDDTKKKDDAGRPDPKYFRLWKHITDNLKPKDRVGKRPKPEAVYREAEGALLTLAGQWRLRAKQIAEADPAGQPVPPVLIVVCDNTEVAREIFQAISGERQEEYEDDEGKTRSRTVYDQSKVFPEFQNEEGVRRTIRIDSKLLAKIETEEGESKDEAAKALRDLIDTVGKPGQPGEQVRCVVSVAMLTEGWDANNVTHVLGLRAFGSQLLCEQVVGRGLRRMDYVPDPATGLLREEYVDIYGVPFSLLPFRGRTPGAPEPVEDRPANHVFAMPERAAFTIQFPVVEGYAFALRRNVITADIDAMQPLAIDPFHVPTATFVLPQVGYRVGAPTLNDPFAVEEQTREQYYASTHLQAIEFQIAQQIVYALTQSSPDGGGAGPARAFHADALARVTLRNQSRHQLFPQVLRLVHAYVQRRVHFHGANPCELGQETYFRRVVERLLAAIRPDEGQGEAPLLPLLNRYEPVGSTERVNFKTVRPCFGTRASHINQVAADTRQWEQTAAFRLEQAALPAHGSVLFYARNDGLSFTIPYEWMQLPLHYEPDFLVRLANGVTLVLEIKGAEDDQDRAKHEAARRWCDAVNNWGKLGKWAFHVCKDPQVLENELRGIVQI
jgi:type III restriction enzyme